MWNEKECVAVIAVVAVVAAVAVVVVAAVAVVVAAEGRQMSTHFHQRNKDMIMFWWIEPLLTKLVWLERQCWKQNTERFQERREKDDQAKAWLSYLFGDQLNGLVSFSMDYDMHLESLIIWCQHVKNFVRCLLLLEAICWTSLDLTWNKQRLYLKLGSHDKDWALAY